MSKIYSIGNTWNLRSRHLKYAARDGIMQKPQMIALQPYLANN